MSESHPINHAADDEQEAMERQRFEKPAGVEQMSITLGPRTRTTALEDVSETANKLAQTLWWIVGNSDLTGEINRRAREAVASYQQMAKSHNLRSLNSPSPKLKDDAVEAGRVVLEGRGNGLYSEAEDAIRLLLAAIAELSPKAKGRIRR
jgi:hypothetical protein